MSPKKIKIKGHAHFKGEVIRNSENMLTNFKSLQNHWANFNKTWHKAFLGDGDSIFFANKGPRFFQGDILTKKRKYTDETSRTNGPSSTKLDTKLPLVVGIQVYSNKEPRSYPRRDNYEISQRKFCQRKYTDKNKNNLLFPEPLGQFQLNLSQSILGCLGLKFVQKKSLAHFWGQIIAK